MLQNTAVAGTSIRLFYSPGAVISTARLVSPFWGCIFRGRLSFPPFFFGRADRFEMMRVYCFIPSHARLRAIPVRVNLISNVRLMLSIGFRSSKNQTLVCPFVLFCRAAATVSHEGETGSVPEVVITAHRRNAIQTGRRRKIGARCSRCFGALVRTSIEGTISVPGLFRNRPRLMDAVKGNGTQISTNMGAWMCECVCVGEAACSESFSGSGTKPTRQTASDAPELHWSFCVCRVSVMTWTWMADGRIEWIFFGEDWNTSRPGSSLINNQILVRRRLSSPYGARWESNARFDHHWTGKIVI